MKAKIVFTGSCETEEQLRLFVQAAASLNDGVPKSVFKDEYMWKVMTEGRAGPDDSHPGSTALDDTGGFFEEQDGVVYLTPKAKRCIAL